MPTNQSGKGSWPPRNCGTPAFREGWDLIFKKKNESVSQEEHNSEQSPLKQKPARDSDSDNSQSTNTP